MYDHALWRAKSFLQAQDIAFVPGLNEDLAATAVWGSQQVGLFPGAKVDGVFGIWYGKGPGVDRSVDALKHANSAGSSRHGGVLALAGDDHGCQSSTLAHQSEQVFAAALMPIINPGDAAGLSRSRPLWLCAVALFRLLGRLQGDRRDGRKLGLDLQRPDRGSRSCCRPISRCRPAGSTSAGPIRRWRPSGGCSARRWRRCRPSRAPTSSTASCSTASRRGSASSRPARPISICGRRWPTSASPTRTPRRWACASTRSR